LTRGLPDYAGPGGIAIGALRIDVIFNSSLSTTVQPHQFTRSKVLPPGWFIGLVLGLLPLIGFSSSESPLPKIEEVVKRALECGKLEEENDLKFKQQYYFVRSRKTEIRNADGDLKKSKTKISTNSPLAILAFMAAQNPATRPPTASPKQTVSSKTEKPEIPPEVAAKFDKKKFQFDQALANRFDFKLVGREQTNGNSMLVVDFAPKKTKLPEKGLQDRVINRMAGRVWLDEREFAVQKCAVRLTESINIVGGIVGEAQKFFYAFERERTEDGLWYVRESKWHLEGRQVVVHREADYHETRTNVRKEVPAK
jgi:hypothetical protein